MHCDLSQPVNDHCPQGQVCGWNTILENRDWKGWSNAYASYLKVVKSQFESEI